MKNQIMFKIIMTSIFIILIFLIRTNKLDSQENLIKKYATDSFMGIVINGDFDNDPNLDFVIITQERLGQHYLIDDVCHQPYESILVYRDYDKKFARIIEKIRHCVNNLLNEHPNEIVVFGRYSKDLSLTKGMTDGYLELASILIYDEKAENKIFGRYRPYSFEGVWGGIRDR